LGGYLAGDHPIKVNNATSSLKITHYNWSGVSNANRSTVGFYPAVRVVDLKGVPLAAYKPDLKHPINKEIACIHRVGCAMPGEVNYPGHEVANDHLQQEFLDYARSFIKTHIPKATGEVITTQEWIDKSSYPAARRHALQELYDRRSPLDPKDFECKSFIKDEIYVEYKAPRGINSYSDKLKLRWGPLIYKFDKTLFSTKWFIKGTIPKEWPAMLRDLFGNEPVMETDFSAFESHHRGVFGVVVREAFEHVLGPYGDNEELALLLEVMKGRNVIKFNNVTAEVDERLMSGALWTSSANGLLNLLIMSFLCAKTVFPHVRPCDVVDRVDDYFLGKVEGDDGICKDVRVDQDLIDNLGIRLKFERHALYGDANFCGVTCASILKDNIITSPTKFLRKFFCLPVKYMGHKTTSHLALLRAKALSYKYNYGTCPVVGPVCDWVLTRTKSIDHRKGIDLMGGESYWHKETLARLSVAAISELTHTKIEPCHEDRMHMEAVFGFSVEMQSIIENSLDNNVDEVRADFMMLASDVDEAHSAKYLNMIDQGHLPDVKGRTKMGKVKAIATRVRRFVPPEHAYE
jgi:hypothetical protein